MTTISPQLASLLKQTALSPSEDKYHIHSLLGTDVPHESFEQPKNISGKTGNDLLNICEQKAKHELLCYLMCVYHKLEGCA